MKKLTFIMAGLVLFLGLAALRAEASANNLLPPATQTIAFTVHDVIPAGETWARNWWSLANLAVDSSMYICQITPTDEFGPEVEAKGQYSTDFNAVSVSFFMQTPPANNIPVSAAVTCTPPTQSAIQFFP